MHELSICQALVDQVDRIVLDNNATGVARIVLQIGPLSGVEAHLLEHAFPLAVAGTLAENSALEINEQPIEVECSICGVRSEAAPNRLLCGSCGAWQTRLVSGDEMLLESVELICAEEANHV